MTIFKFNPLMLGFIIILFQSVIIGQALASEEKKEDDNTSKEVYMTVPPFAVTMYHRGRPRGNMTISMTVKVEDDEKRATAIQYMPRLNNAYVMEANRLSHGYFDINRPVNVGMLGDAFQLVTNKVLGHKQARVFISNIIIHKK